MRQYSLSTHAVQRILERTPRAPAWLVDVLAKGQFAHLQFGGPDRRHYALVYDALEDTYLVAILSKQDPRVVTVLTQEQYENLHGTVPEVLCKLAQLARAQEVAPAPGPPESSSRTPWSSRWTAHLTVEGFRQRRKFKVALDTAWRQECLRKAWGLVPCVDPHLNRQLNFEVQVVALSSTNEFQHWLHNTLLLRGERIALLETVSLASAHEMNVQMDVTNIVKQQLMKS